MSKSKADSVSVKISRSGQPTDKRRVSFAVGRARPGAPRPPGLVVDAVALVRMHGIIVESGSRHRPVFTEEIAGELINGSWWGHKKAHAIFGATRIVRRSPEVLVCRLVQRKVTYVHKSHWPALFRLRNEIGSARLAHIKEEHTQSGAHRVRTIPFNQWTSDGVRQQGASLSRAEALGSLPAHIRASLGIDD